jgi:SAM-dependent methyltransferase
MSGYSPKEYWSGIAEEFRSADADGFAPVVHPGVPSWFNRMIDGLQYRALRRALALAGIPADARILDVGCGSGRWIRRYQELGYHAAGVDAASAMLLLARQHRTNSPILAGEAHRLPLADSVFDCVSDVTVVQHIPASLQRQALAEMMRVLKPGGRLILMELIRGKGPHIFPRSPQDWIELAASHGAKLIGWFGQEFLLLDRAFVRAALFATGWNRIRSAGKTLPRESASGPVSTSRRLYWALRRVTAPFSAWADPFIEKICPAKLATHGVFVFSK